jgi:streptomycin 6-kinase
MMLETLLADWSLTNPRLLAKTATSHVWQVDQSNGTAAALKLLHAPKLPTLQPLASRMALLRRAASSGPIGAAAQLAEHLLQTATVKAALHGDLHYDNILKGTRGWLAIDPKGVWGDPAYETANAFRNPEGAGDLIFQPSRIQTMADCFARRLRHDPRRILGWAAVHCALSIIWSQDAGKGTADDMRLLPILLSAAA